MVPPTIAGKASSKTIFYGRAVSYNCLLKDAFFHQTKLQSLEGLLVSHNYLVRDQKSSHTHYWWSLQLVNNIWCQISKESLFAKDSGIVCIDMDGCAIWKDRNDNYNGGGWWAISVFVFVSVFIFVIVFIYVFVWQLKWRREGLWRHICNCIWFKASPAWGQCIKSENKDWSGFFPPWLM